MPRKSTGLASKSTRDTILFIVTILGVLAGGAWTVFTYFVPRAEQPAKQLPPPPQRPTVIAREGGVAIGGNTDNTTISVVPGGKK